MGKVLNRENLEELRDINMNIQEEIWYWRQRENGMEKDLAKIRNSFTSMRTELDKRRL